MLNLALVPVHKVRYLNYSIFWVTTRSKLIWNRRFGTTYRYHLQGYFCTVWHLKMGPIHSPETSVLNQLMPRNNPENGRIEFNCGGGLRSRTVVAFAVFVIMLSDFFLKFHFICLRKFYDFHLCNSTTETHTYRKENILTFHHLHTPALHILVPRSDLATSYRM